MGRPLTTRPTFNWDAVSGATGYTFQLSTSATFSSLNANIKVSTPSYSVTGDLTRLKTYYWRVLANGSKSSAWAQVFTFISANPPAIPSLSKPANGALLTDYQPRLDWQGTGAHAYQIQLVNSSSFSASSLIMDLNMTVGTHYDQPAPLPANSNYYWHARALDADGEYSLWSPNLYFKTAMLPPAPLDPVNAGSALTTRSTLDWSTVSGATGYAIQISNSSSFSSEIVDSATGNPIYTPSSDLPRSILLYWRVSAT
jgi:hypothetical protein